MVVDEFQLKATDSVDYIANALAEYPEVPIIVTTEVAGEIETDLVIDSGISETALEGAVSETLFEEVSPISPLSVLGWLFGLPGDRKSVV